MFIFRPTLRSTWPFLCMCARRFTNNKELLQLQIDSELMFLISKTANNKELLQLQIDIELMFLISKILQLKYSRMLCIRNRQQIITGKQTHINRHGQPKNVDKKFSIQMRVKLAFCKNFKPPNLLYTYFKGARSLLATGLIETNAIKKRI